MRFILRFGSFLLLVAAVGSAALDTVQSIARSVIDVTSVKAAWVALYPQGLDTMMRVLDASPFRGLANGPVTFVLAQPLAALCLVLSLLLWMAGYRRVPPAGRFAA